MHQIKNNIQVKDLDYKTHYSIFFLQVKQCTMSKKR